ncbi:EamA family transporter [Sneathiella sp. DP05]|uniref:EamA family transporter n=1 Tax=Sneathiella litorea TaxID=2606216 RepID=A0A6L8W4Y4_9PROT|nr:EamA family transporter [Sneathiella litorea]
MSASTINRPREYLLLVLLASLWGSSYLLIRIGVETIPPTSLVALRVSVAAFVLLTVIWWQGYRLPTDFSTWRSFVIQSFFNSFGAWVLLAWGQQYVESGLATVLNSTSPIFVFFLTWLVTKHETVTARKISGAFIGLAGVVMIIGVDVLQNLGQQVIAQVAILASAMLYGYAAIYGKRFAALPSTVTAAGVMISATLVLVPASLIIDRPWTLSPSASSLVAVVTLGTFGTALALLLYFRLINTLGSLGTASQSYLRMGIGVMLGIVILGEQFSLIVGLGLVIAICGVALINIPAKRR